MSESRRLSRSPAYWEPEKKVSEAWWDFEEALADALRSLPVGAVLELTLDPVASATEDARYSVVISVRESGLLIARAVSNTSLPEGYRLNRAAIAELIALGWSPPGVELSSDKDFGISAEQGEAARMAAIIVRTLSDIYGAPHPAFLVYVGRDPHGGELEVPPLGTARRLTQLPRSDNAVDPLPLREQVRAVIAAMQRTSSDQLLTDSDGNIGIPAGTAMVFVRVRDNPPLVDVFSPMLTEIPSSEPLYRRLSELTNAMPVGRLYYANGTVWGSVPVFGRSFQPSHLVLAVQVMTGLADELDDRLHSEFGGRRYFEDATIPVDAFLDTESHSAARRVVSALDEIALLLGYEEPAEERWSSGSIWRRARTRLRSGITSEEVRRRLVKLERALELAHLDARQAEVDSKTAMAVTQLIASLDAIPQACLLVGSILIVKYHDGNAPVLYSRNLTQSEIRALEKFPEIQTKPAGVLEALATALANLPSIDAQGS